MSDPLIFVLAVLAVICLVVAMFYHLILMAQREQRLVEERETDRNQLQKFGAGHGSAQGYMAAKDTIFRYPRAGDTPAPRGAKVLILTEGGVCVVGQWKDERWCIGWHPLPGRDRTKEQA